MSETDLEHQAERRAYWRAEANRLAAEKMELEDEIARLREREAQLERERDYFQSRLPDFSATQQADFARAEAAEARFEKFAKDMADEISKREARVARLEEALRKIVEVAKPLRHQSGQIARRALAHEEPKGSMNNPITKDDLPMTVGPGEFWVAHEEEGSVELSSGNEFYGVVAHEGEKS